MMLERASTSMRARSIHTHSLRVSSTRPRRAGRGQLQVLAAAKAPKKVEVVLSKEIASLGRAGEVKKVSVGYLKNYLLPQGLAEPATEQVLSQIKAQQDRASAEKEAVKEGAQRIATALSLAKNFVIKKEASDEDSTYGSVTLTELKAVIKKQTGVDLEDNMIDLPVIKELGTFPVTATLHPEVKADFTVTVQKS